jgi:host factor-I protein
MVPNASNDGKKYFLQKCINSDMIFLMEVQKEESKQTIEPQFLSQALVNGIRLRIGQMNKTEYEGLLHDVGRYEINLEVNGALITLLKQEISYLSAPQPVLSRPAFQPPQSGSEPSSTSQAAVASRPNIQQEFLDKAIRENQLLTLYLVNGQRIKAHIEGYDSFTLLLSEGGRQHLYYKHAITTINR